MNKRTKPPQIADSASNSTSNQAPTEIRFTDQDLRERADRIVRNYSAPVDVHCGVLAAAIFRELVVVRGLDFPNFRQSSSPTESGAESVHSDKQNTADKSGAASPELLPTQLDTRTETIKPPKET